MDLRFNHNDYSVLLCVSGIVSHTSETQLMGIQKKTSCLHGRVYCVIDSFTIIRPAVKSTCPNFPPQRKFPSNWIIFLKWKTAIKVSKQRTILVETKESNHVMKNARFYFVNLTEEKKRTSTSTITATPIIYAFCK